MRHCLVAMGGNVGPVETTFAQAVDSMRRSDGVIIESISSNHRTAPVGTESGGDFLNAAFCVRTSLNPLELLDSLQQVENANGRVRNRRWEPRTLDLDLITFGNEVVDEPRLIVPHPACWYRRFVLDPIVEIAADVVHPVQQKTFAELRQRLLRRPLPYGLHGGDEQARKNIAARLLATFPPETVAQVGESSADAAFVFDLDLPPLKLSQAAGVQASRLHVPGNDVDEQFCFVCDVLAAALG